MRPVPPRWADITLSLCGFCPVTFSSPVNRQRLDCALNHPTRRRRADLQVSGDLLHLLVPDLGLESLSFLLRV